MKIADQQWRYRVTTILFMVGAVVLVGALFKIQVIDHHEYSIKAQQQSGVQIVEHAARGDIKSSDGFELASNEPAYKITADPQLIGDPHKAAEQIIKALATPTPTPTPGHQATSSATKQTDDQQEAINKLEAELSNKARRYYAIASKVEEARAQKVRDLNLKGVFLVADPKRYYPEGSLLSQVLGYVGLDTDGNDKGWSGIEGYYDNELKGRDGWLEFTKDLADNPIPVASYQSQPAVNGTNITLTIDRGLQYMVEQKLKQGVEANKADGGSVILMEPSTGRILAMANYPTYNSADWAAALAKDPNLLRNSAIEDTYEPGSVMKAFTVATGLELGVLTPDSTYESAPYKVDDATINTADHKYYGKATVTEMLQHSDNTGAAQFGLQIGADNFIEWLRKIGLDHPTGITLTSEANSQIPARKDWLKITLATASFGQGISLTPLQLLEMMSTIANDGVQMKPTIIQSIERDNGTVEVKPQTVGRVYSQKTTDQMDVMLQNVVQNGEFHRLALQGYHIAGKTGTAQIPLSTGGYDPDHVITTFVGYAPATKPKFIMLAKLNKPSVNNSAVTVVPVWMNIAQELFRYYGIAPEPTPTPTPAQ